MAASPASGVVDPNGQVFGVPNLYVAGASVFPTCGHANLTLTILATAIRLADHLKGQLSQPARSEVARATTGG
jgi:choline dehydrogenase-like flavoprotein